jgi:type I restriction enzyme S subunit
LSFDDLRKLVAGDYDALKDIVFTLLAEAQPSLTQVFDVDVQAMRFQRAKS